MAQFLDLIGWLACIVYSTIPPFWLTIHPFANYWRSRRSPYRVLFTVWIAMWIAAGLVTASWRGVALYSNPLAWVPAAFLFGAGFWLYSQSGKHFTATKLSGFPEITPGRALDHDRDTQPRSPSRLPCASLRDACLEHRYWSSRLLRLDGVCDH
jgi:hypothetical protein